MKFYEVLSPLCFGKFCTLKDGGEGNEFKQQYLLKFSEI